MCIPDKAFSNSTAFYNDILDLNLVHIELNNVLKERGSPV